MARPTLLCRLYWPIANEFAPTGGLIIVAGIYDRTRAEWVIGKGYADLVAFGRPFVANPDLPLCLETSCAS